MAANRFGGIGDRLDFRRTFRDHTGEVRNVDENHARVGVMVEEDRIAAHVVLLLQYCCSKSLHATPATAQVFYSATRTLIIGMDSVLQGIGVSPGAVSGPVYLMAEAVPAERKAGSPLQEQRAYQRASQESVRQLERLAAELRSGGLEEQAGILDAQMLMLNDPGWIELVTQAIAEGATAEQAVRVAGEAFAGMFQAMDDPYLAARAADVRDIANRLQGALGGAAPMPLLTRPSIIVAQELTPSQTVSLDRALVLGFATDTGSATAHTAILARALNIPAVVGVPGLSSRVQPGGQIALDGESGAVILDPSEEQRQQYAGRAAALKRRRSQLRSIRNQPAETRDGRRLVLAANIGSPDDMAAAREAGAEGVGLFRTEFLFADRPRMPTEEEQVEVYRSVLAAMPEHRVIIRTLDIGGDKPLPYLPPSAEANPFLGQRGIRYTLAHPQLMRIQLRALLRASPAGRLAIMLPMVSELAQIHEVTTLLEELQAEVGGSAELGIMIEVPAAALQAAQFARHVAFFSVGSNDLTQYTLAVDRGNAQVASLYRPLHPGLMRLLDQTSRGAQQHGRWTGICGELAGDLLAIPFLIGLGFEELSMTPGRIPEARARIRSLDAARCRQLAAEALECETADEVEALSAGL